MVRVILDMDPGVDDAVALAMAARSRDLEILGVTVVSGNVYVDKGVVNALRVLDYIGMSSVDVYRGSEKPLLRDLVTSEHIHGMDGLGDSGIPISSRSARSTDAVRFLIETLSRERAFVVVTGPLTNIARALLAEPSISGNIEELIIMGGVFGLSEYGVGNVTPYAEYNFYVDPEAAKIIIRSGVRLRIVSLDVTQNPRVRMTREISKKILGIGSKAAELIYRITKNPIERHGHFELHDAIAMASLLDQRVVRYREAYISIDTCMERGRSILHIEREHSDGRAYVSYSIDSERFYEILLQLL